MRFSKTIKFILISLIFLILLSFLCKDYVSKKVVLYLIKKNLNSECSLSDIEISFSKIMIDNLEILNKDFNLSLSRGQLDFEFSEFLTIRLVSVVLEGGDFKVNDLMSVKRLLFKKNSEPVPKKYFFIPVLEKEDVSLNLKDINH